MMRQVGYSLQYTWLRFTRTMLRVEHQSLASYHWDNLTRMAHPTDVPTYTWVFQRTRCRAIWLWIKLLIPRAGMYAAIPLRNVWCHWWPCRPWRGAVGHTYGMLLARLRARV